MASHVFQRLFPTPSVESPRNNMFFFAVSLNVQLLVAFKKQQPQTPDLTILKEAP